MLQNPFRKSTCKWTRQCKWALPAQGPYYMSDCIWHKNDMKDNSNTNLTFAKRYSSTWYIHTGSIVHNHLPASISSVSCNRKRHFSIKPTSVHAWRLRVLFLRIAVKWLHNSPWNTSVNFHVWTDYFLLSLEDYVQLRKRIFFWMDRSSTRNSLIKMSMIHM